MTVDIHTDNRIQKLIQGEIEKILEELRTNKKEVAAETPEVYTLIGILENDLEEIDCHGGESTQQPDLIVLTTISSLTSQLNWILSNHTHKLYLFAHKILNYLQNLQNYIWQKLSRRPILIRGASPEI